MHGFNSTRDFVSQGIVAAILVGVFALLAAERMQRVSSRWARWRSCG